MNKYQWAYIIGCSAFAVIVISTLYESQFKDGEWEFEFDENFLGDLTLLREVENEKV